jgi:hypothetical protein
MKRLQGSSLFLSFVCVLASIATPQRLAVADHTQASPPRSTVFTHAFSVETKEFLAREVGTHFADIKSLDPPPEKVFNALTVGEFSWGSFARALAAQADLGGNRTIAGKDTARAIAEMGLIESRRGGKAFAQLYSLLALRHFGTDLSKNAVWLSMNERERKEWNSLLDPARFYDPNKRAVINLPENYLGVAARVAAMSFEMGVLKDRALLDSVVERAAEQFTTGAIYSDDNPPTGRYDRYSNEYARFCWDAADIARRTDIKERLKPSLKEQMKLWWDLVSPAGYSYNWGRSQGLVSYLDTLEIVAFLGENPEFRPALMTELAALYNQAWRWIRADYNDETHMFRVFDYGRGNYSYINPKREWQQTGTAFGKIILANNSFLHTLEREKIADFPALPFLPDVARFDFFTKTSNKQLGVWLVRRGKLQFALPITVGPKPGVADYLPAPFGLPGFAAPVEEVYPSFVPFITLADERTYAASDGADRIETSSDGSTLRTVNTKWAQVGTKSGERFENGLVSEVEWRLLGNRLVRTEKLTATSDVQIKTWKFALPSTASVVRDSGNIYSFEGREGKMKAEFAPFGGTEFSVFATGDSRLGKGVLGAIPLHVTANAKDINIKRGQSLTWKVSLELKN